MYRVKHFSVLVFIISLGVKLHLLDNDHLIGLVYFDLVISPNANVLEANIVANNTVNVFKMTSFI